MLSNIQSGKMRIVYFHIGNLRTFKMKGMMATRLKYMIEYVEAIDKSSTADEAAHYREKSEELLNSYDFSNIDITEESDIAPLLVACSVGFLSFLEKWKSHGLSFNVVDRDGNTPLHYVAKNAWFMSNWLKTAQFLLQNGAEAFRSNQRMQNPLHCMSAFDEKQGYNPGCPAEIIEGLINSGADINHVDASGLSPVFYALDCRDKGQRIEDMLNFGANFSVENGSGRNSILKIFVSWFTEFVQYMTDEDFLISLLTKAEKAVRHVTRLNVLGLRVSESVQASNDELMLAVEAMRKVYPMISNDKHLGRKTIDKFKEHCEREKEKMKSLKLDGVNSMFDLSKRSVSELLTFTYKKVFQEYFSSNEYRRDFPIYWFILRLQFKAAEERRRLLRAPRVILKAFNLPLYDLCLEHILKQFTNEELKEFRSNNECVYREFHEIGE